MLLRRSLAFPNLLKNLLVFGKAATFFEVCVDDMVVNSHLEDAAMSLFQIHLNAKLFFDCSLQTGGLSKVTSFDAVGDLDVYRFLRVTGIAHNESPFGFSFL
jgi:hypothetical protein